MKKFLLKKGGFSVVYPIPIAVRDNVTFSGHSDDVEKLNIMPRSGIAISTRFPQPTLSIGRPFMPVPFPPPVLPLASAFPIGISPRGPAFRFPDGSYSPVPRELSFLNARGPAFFINYQMGTKMNGSGVLIVNGDNVILVKSATKAGNVLMDCGGIFIGGGDIRENAKKELFEETAGTFQLADKDLLQAYIDAPTDDGSGHKKYTYRSFIIKIDDLDFADIIAKYKTNNLFRGTDKQKYKDYLESDAICLVNLKKAKETDYATIDITPDKGTTSVTYIIDERAKYILKKCVDNFANIQHMPSLKLNPATYSVDGKDIKYFIITKS